MSESGIHFIEDDLREFDDFVAAGLEQLLGYLSNWAAFGDIFPEREA